MIPITSSSIQHEIGQRIRELLEERDITQERFASKAGINRSYFADIEMGNRNFGIDTLVRIVDGFDLTMEEFFRGM